MWLDCGEHGRVDLSRLTPKTVVARTKQDIPPCFADLIVMVDGQRLQRRVNITGFSKGRRVARVFEADDSAPF